MNNCEICGQELINGEFEEKLGICVNCIMVDSRKDSFKSLLNVFLIFLGGIILITAIFPVFLSLPFIILGIENYYFLIPPLIVCVLVGPGVIYLTFLYKFR